MTEPVQQQDAFSTGHPLVRFLSRGGHIAGHIPKIANGARAMGTGFGHDSTGTLFNVPSVPLRRGRNPLSRAQVEEIQRERLMAAATMCLSQKGFRQTKVTDIVSLAGVSLGTFYDCFENKDVCLLAAYDRFLETISRRLGQSLRNSCDWGEAIENMTGELVALVDEDPRSARAFLVEVEAMGSDVRRRRGQFFRANCDAVKQWRETLSSGAPKVASIAYVTVSLAIHDVIGDALVVEPHQPVTRLRRFLSHFLQTVLEDTSPWPDVQVRAPVCESKVWPGHDTTPPAASATCEEALSPSRQSPHEQKSSRTRSRILGAAGQVLSTEGRAGLRLRDVAAHAHVQPSTVYRYFHSREELVNAVISSKVREMCDDVSAGLAAVAANSSHQQRILSIVETYLRRQLTMSDPSTRGLAAADQLLRADAQADGREATYADAWREPFAQASASGELRTDVDPDLAQMMVLGALQWTARQWDPRAVSADAAVRTARDFVRAALFAPEPDAGQPVALT